MKFLLNFCLAGLILNFSLAALAAPAASGAGTGGLKIQFPVEKYQLANGLTVLLHEDHNVPMISYHTWYRVGSRDEGPGVTGAAHMLEHMMFKGAKKYSGKQFDQTLHENGITNNAFTSNDYTGFYENLPSSKLELIMDMEVDRMRSLSLNPEDLTSELQVVGEERRWRVDNSPQGLLQEMFFGSLFKVHPYSWPVIGHMVDIQAYTSEKLRKFYDTFYVPNNAILVLAGDFNSEEVKRLIEKHYGSLPRKEIPARAYSAEPELLKPIKKELQWEVQSNSFLIGYKGVALGTKDAYALDLAAAALGEGASSRLHRHLVYKSQVAVGASAYNWTNADPGAFMIMVTMRPGLPSTQAEQIVSEEVDRMINSVISEKELQKVKNQTMKGFVDSLATIDAKARTLAANEIIFGDYQRVFLDLEEYNKVTAKDIQQVMQKYLKKERQVRAFLTPIKSEKGKKISQ